MTDQSHSLDRVRRERERFLTDPGRTHEPAVRSEILASWDRSRRIGLDVDAVELPYDDDFPRPRRLQAAARPVIRELLTTLSAVSTAAVMVADAEGRIVEQYAAQPGFLPVLDRAQAAPGFRFSEDFAGTNGIGCAIEERRLFAVRGPEHFREHLQSLICVAAPVLHPLRGTVVGAVNITCDVRESSPLMGALLSRVAMDIQAALRSTVTQRERLLLDAFVAASRRTADPVIAVGDDLFFGNARAVAITDETDRIRLWAWARSEASGTLDARLTTVLADGQLVTAAASAVRSPAGRLVGAIVTLHPQRAERAAPTPGKQTAPSATGDILTGSSAALQKLRAAVVRATGRGGPVLIAGEPGSGRTRVARHLLSLLSESDPVELSTHDPDLEIAALRAVDDSRPLLLTDLDADVDTDLVERLLRRAAGRSIPVVATIRWLSDAATLPIRSAADVPPLRSRISDVPALAGELLREIGGCSAPPRLHPAVLAALCQRDWPGNTRELRLVLSVASDRCRGGEITIADLPADYRPSAGPSLTLMGRSERDLIVATLQECGGNKKDAAARLGIARSSLYRKLRALRIETP